MAVVESPRPERPIAAPDTDLPRLAVIAIYVVFAAVATAPILCVRLPVLGDYFNHLARIHILTTIGTSPALQRFYDPHWHFVPYFGMDLPVAVLAAIMPLYDAGKVFVIMCVLMPVLAACVLHYAVYRRVGIVPAFAFVVCYNYLLARGFLNYLFSAGLAVMLFGGWIAATPWPRWQRALLFCLATPLLYLAHPFAFLAYGILVAGLEFGAAARSRFRPAAFVAAHLLAAAVQVVPVLVLLGALEPSAALGAASITDFGPLLGKLNALITPLKFAGSVVVVAICTIVPLGGLMLSWRQIRLAPIAWPALAAVAIVACFMPKVVVSVWGADYRLPLVTVMVLAGIAAPARQLSRRAAIRILAVCLAVVVIRSVDVYRLLSRLEFQAEGVEHLVNLLPQGAKLLVVDGPVDAPLRVAPSVFTDQFGMLATIERGAFVPFLFAGVTTLHILPQWLDYASPNASALTFDQLNEGAEAPPPKGQLPRWGYSGQKYWLGWPEKFDYVLITHFGADTIPRTGNLQLLAAGETANLYKVKRSGEIR